MKKCLVTGASGFIGRSFCNRLRHDGIYVRGLLRNVTEGPWDETVLCDLGNDIIPHHTMDGVDTIFHLAGKAHALSELIENDQEYHGINVEGTKKLLEEGAKAGVKRFVFASSIKTTGEGGKSCLNESCTIPPETLYGCSKLEAEHLVLNGGYIPHTCVLRLSMVYGPGSGGNLVKMIKAISGGRFPPLPEVGNKRSMVHVEDVVDAALLAAHNDKAAGKIYIVTDGKIYSTRQIYEWVCESLDRPVSAFKMPVGVIKILAKIGDGIGQMRGRRFIFDTDAMNKLLGSAWYSSAKIEQELGFKPKRCLQESLPGIVRAIDGLRCTCLKR